jgi:hypothetical protein
VQLWIFGDDDVATLDFLSMQCRDAGLVLLRHPPEPWRGSVHVERVELFLKEVVEFASLAELDARMTGQVLLVLRSNSSLLCLAVRIATQFVVELVLKIEWAIFWPWSNLSDARHLIIVSRARTAPLDQSNMPKTLTKEAKRCLNICHVLRGLRYQLPSRAKSTPKNVAQRN